MAPAFTKNAVSKLAPIKLRHPPSFRGADVKALVFPILIGVFAAVCWELQITPFFDALRDANTTLCGGTQNFVYGQDSLGMTYVVTDMKTPDELHATNRFVDPQYRAFMEIKSA